MVLNWQEILNHNYSYTADGSIFSFQDNPADEAKLINNTNLVSPLAYNVISLKGIKAKEFMQRQFTPDVNDINKNTSSTGYYCNHKGKILAKLTIMEYLDEIYLCLPSSLVLKFTDKIKNFAKFSKLEVGINQDMLLFGIYIKGNIDFLPSKLNQGIIYQDCYYTKIAPKQYYALINKDHFQKFWQFWQQQAKYIGTNCWNLINIFNKNLEIYANTSEQIFPQSIITDTQQNYISYNKGCYLGQEVIARMHYRGQTKYHAYPAMINCSAIIEPATDIFAKDNNAGLVLMSAINSDNLISASILIHDKFKGRELHLSDGTSIFNL